MNEPIDRQLRVIHCFRSPIGGVFRHVRDLISEQVSRGHKLGIICDSSTGGDYEAGLFKSLEPKLELGLYRIPMERAISPRDLTALWQTYRILKRTQPDIVHSHSAKGGVYGRLGAKLASLGSEKIGTLYCPHGGAMHYEHSSLNGRIYFIVERFLEVVTDRLVFVSKYERDAYHEKVGTPGCEESVVYNGLAKQEFKPVRHEKGATEFLYIGMMRNMKGPDVFLRALKRARELSRKDLKAWFVGDGPDKQDYIRLIDELDLQDCVFVSTAMPAREAFKKAEIVVAPSRAESMPYLVLEAIAAQKPIVATHVGGIPEIFGEYSNRLVDPGDHEMLATRMLDTLLDKDRGKKAGQLMTLLKGRFSVQSMTEGVHQAYLASL